MSITLTVETHGAHTDGSATHSNSKGPLHTCNWTSTCGRNYQPELWPVKRFGDFVYNHQTAINVRREREREEDWTKEGNYLPPALFLIKT